MRRPHRFQYEDRQERGSHVHYHGNGEYGMPIAGNRRQYIAQRHEKRRSALRSVEQARIRGSISRSVGICTGGREQAVDFTPRKEDEAAE
jgi:hypothetical protein